MTSLYLASGSPRRQELLAQLGVTFERIVTGIEEQRQPQESAQQYVVRLAREKAQAGVAQTAQADVAQIIGSDPSGNDGSGVGRQPAHSRLPGGHRCDFQNVNRRRHRGLCRQR